VWIRLTYPEAVHTIVWQFAVQEGCVDMFVAAYGPAGDWARLFQKGRGFRGTTLLRDAADPLRFVTVDRWDSAEDFARFHADFEGAYAELDRRFEQLTISEQLVGRFSEES
jgi:heme-degrading monooxygenase HmoA